ncbi:hypothetical protein [Phycicoccus avicenniae]|uniref:hypothetical protein n=1 Tax=Phycicoccus avicenniae TaxID=2828860 RepID=UPI003D2D9DB1
MKRTIVSALALSGALVLGACGSATNDTGTGSKAAATSEAPAAATAKVGDTVDLAELGAKSQAATQAKRTSHMTMDMGSQGKAEADVDYSDGATKMSMSMDAEGEKLQIVYADKVMYLGGDSFAELAGGKKWIKIDPKGKDMMSQMMGPMIGQMESSMSNPAGELANLKGTKATVTKVENGVTTYEVKLTAEQMKEMVKKQASGIPGVSEDALKQMLESNAMPDGLTYELSIDAEGLPTKVVAGLKGQAVTMEYSKWGEPVDIKVPAASEVGTFEMPTS